jgi:hypothetical protein
MRQACQMVVLLFSVVLFYGCSAAQPSNIKSICAIFDEQEDWYDYAIDFIGWYNRQSYQRSNIALNDSYHLYLAYHEGHGGFNRRSFKGKS